VIKKRWRENKRIGIRDKKGKARGIKKIARNHNNKRGT